MSRAIGAIAQIEGSGAFGTGGMEPSGRAYGFFGGGGAEPGFGSSSSGTGDFGPVGKRAAIIWGASVVWLFLVWRAVKGY